MTAKSLSDAIIKAMARDHGIETMRFAGVLHVAEYFRLADAIGCEWISTDGWTHRDMHDWLGY